MASKFWVGGGSTTNWNATANTNWSDTDGGAGNAAVPSAGDAVFFNGNSGTGASVWNTAISLTGLTCTGSKNLVTHNAITITLSAGDLLLPSGVGATFTSNASANFTFTGVGTQLITTSGKIPANLTFNGVGGTFQLQDNLTCLSTSSTITLTTGTFDGQSFTVTAQKFASVSGNTRAIVGSGLWTLGTGNATGTLWNVSSTLTASSFTSNITINGTTASSRTWTGAATPVALAGTLTLGANTSGGQFIFTSGNTFGNFAPAGPNYIVLPSGTGITLTNAPTIAGSSGSEIGFISSTIGTGAPISVAGGTAAFSWCSFRDVTGSGGATFTATNSFDLGGNAGITITAPTGATGGGFSAGFF